MNPEIVKNLQNINREFYQTFALSFAATRGRIQPGIRLILNEIPLAGTWLDIGCGNGALAAEWTTQKRTGLYFGIDFSQPLIDTAKSELDKMVIDRNQKIRFRQVDITSLDWLRKIPVFDWKGVFMFAALHHIPGAQYRERLCKEIRSLLQPDCVFYLSVWQIQNSRRLMKRVRPWSDVQIDEKDVDPGDVLMDWRAEVNNEKPVIGFRYVHMFSIEELRALVECSGFREEKFLFSDGKEGNLALYLKCRAI